MCKNFLLKRKLQNHYMYIQMKIHSNTFFLFNHSVKQSQYISLSSKPNKPKISKPISATDGHNLYQISVLLRVFSAYIKDIEDKPGPTAWGAKMPFGEVLLEHKDCGGWVHSVSFSPSGDQLAWVAHNSSISVADAAQKKEWVLRLSLSAVPQYLRFLSINNLYYLS